MKSSQFMPFSHIKQYKTAKIFFLMLRGTYEYSFPLKSDDISDGFKAALNVNENRGHVHTVFIIKISYAR